MIESQALAVTTHIPLCVTSYLGIWRVNIVTPSYDKNTSSLHYITYLLTYSLLEAEPLRTNGLSTSQKFPHFMDSECSLPHSQVPATCTYPKPDQSNPCPNPTSRSILLSSRLRLGLPGCLFPSGFPTETLYKSLLSTPPYMPHAPPIPFFSI